MSAESEQAGQAFQPESVLRWSISQQTRIWTPDAETASQAAQRLANTFFPSADQAGEQGADPLNAELFRVDPDAEETLVSIWAPLTEERTEPNSVTFELKPQADGAVTIMMGRTATTKSGLHDSLAVGERVTTAEALMGTEAVLQAADRSIDLSFPTGEIALKYLASPGVALPKDVIAGYARRQVFSALAKHITEYAGGVARQTETFPTEVEEVFGLVHRYAPHVADDLARLKNKIESQGPQVNDYGGTLFGLARKAYFDLQDEAKRMQFIKEATLLLRTFYRDEQSSKDRPDIVAFDRRHHDPDFAGLQEGELVALFPWTGELVDPRISVAATLFIKCTYNLDRHHFAANDNVVNPRTQLRLTIARGADSASHGEQELAPVMEKQWRQFGGAALTSEQLEEYREKLAQPALVISDTPARSDLRTRRSSGRRLVAARPVDNFFR